MGDPKKQRKKYETPTHPWLRHRIDSEKILTKDYGLKNKKEIWRFESKLRRFRVQAKRLIAGKTEQTKKETIQVISKLVRYGLIKKDAKLEDILDLNIKDILNRRLQTIVFTKGLARTIKQARQFILHGHIYLDNKKVTVPSYLVKVSEEEKIIHNPLSKIAKEDHPERIIKKVKPKKIRVKVKPRRR